MKLLLRTQFGNPILRAPVCTLTNQEISSPDTQELISNMRYTLFKRQYGVGLAAPQIGRSLALSVIGIKPTPSHPKNPTVDLVIINPEIVNTYGKRIGMWEGCISLGKGTDLPYAKALRYKKVHVRYQDEHAELHEQDFSGITAHVLQHEIDHLNGTLFVDRVKDTKTYTTISEYKKRYLKNEKKVKAHQQPNKFVGYLTEALARLCYK